MTVVGVVEVLKYGLSQVFAYKVGIFSGRSLLGWPSMKGLKYWYGNLTEQS